MYHKECHKNEEFVGNVAVKNLADRKLKLSGIKHRFGQQAYDIHGKKLATDYYLPLFISKEDFDKYNRMMTKMTFGR